MYNLVWKFVLQHAVDQTSKLCMQALIPRNQLIGESQARHQAPLLQPVYGTERTTEEHALHSSKCHYALCKAIVPIHPLNCPSSFLLYCWHGLNGIENLIFLYWVANVLLNQERVCLRVNVL